ncbi:TRAP transporter substrate-binding protein [Xinfangfangia pollutisoli]|uniref:TRAP transporter substrate-binding protein n=1 Tax=Xinfangfangia pollutisoli TaxID=2865960 RepID=UPI001CD48553|nr:TRAP transporter substrate-binding protein DctP [Xinfangfangia pollutisoli]
MRIRTTLTGGILALVLTAVAAQAEVQLRMVGAWAPGFSPTAEIGKSFMENVNRLGEGKVSIQFIGADDVMPPLDQPEALVNGVFDVWYGAPNYWAGVVPGGDITELSPAKIPDGGPGTPLYDFLVEAFAAKGVRYLGHAAGVPGVGAHYMTTRFPLTSIDDLKGHPVRVTPLSRHFVQKAGAESITLPPSEIFLALDRGTVDAMTWPIADAYTRYGWQDVTKYLVDQPMYRSGGGLAMNLDKWNALEPEIQQILLDSVKETQLFAQTWFADNQDEQVGLMKAAGMEVITLDPAEAERWNQVVVDALWAYYDTIYSPEQIATIKDLFAAAAQAD